MIKIFFALLGAAIGGWLASEYGVPAVADIIALDPEMEPCIIGIGGFIAGTIFLFLPT